VTLKRRCHACLRVTEAATCPCGNVLITAEEQALIDELGMGERAGEVRRINGRRQPILHRDCEDCGVHMVGIGPGTKYCRPCSKKHKLIYGRETYARRHGRLPKIERRCSCCGVVIPFSGRGRPRQTCAPCNRRRGMQRWQAYRDCVLAS
jgi:hypothetical protein